MSYQIVPAHLAVQAMRDNGYKNAAYAIAELIDNSIQAKASSVEVLCGERKIQRGTKYFKSIEQIAVLDNGDGMDSNTLRIALQFGNGMYLDPEKHTGIGRYGMGLPSSSISQCKRVEVWTWTDGVENALFSYLDIDGIKNENMTEVPAPIKKEIPNIWRKVSKSIGNSGTLVIWTKIDKCTWRTANAIMRNSEFLVGRMYRRFIHDDSVSIRMAAFDLEDISDLSEKYVLPNDPIYLMENTSCPAPFDNTSMFQKDGDDIEHTYPIKFLGKIHDVRIRYAYAKEEARQGSAPGSKPHGKHAAKNLGVSIVRAGRELDLDVSIVNSYNPTERWWGIEVEFPPALDEIFGVTNNKQSARYFSDVLKLDFEDFCNREGVSSTAMLAQMKEEGDPHAHLIEIVRQLKSRLNVMRRLLETQRIGTREQNLRKDNAVDIATEATKERQDEGHVGESDSGETISIEERKKQVKEVLEEMGNSQENIDAILETTFSSSGTLKYIFNHADIESPAFFTIKPRGGEIIISLNVNHPAYEKLFEILESDEAGDDIEVLKTRLLRAREGLRLVLMAWARYEDELDGQPRIKMQQARYDWGTIARNFLTDE